MVITSDKKLSDIKKAFQEMFPFLRIEFYSGRHKTGEGSPKNKQLNDEKTILEVSGKEVHEELEVVPTLSVKELEQYFDRQLGLNVQVFRASGNLWMQTTATDHWTLQEQNRKGGSSQEHYNEKYKS